MRRPKEPFEGYKRDKDQLFYWNMSLVGSGATIPNQAKPFAHDSATKPRDLFGPLGTDFDVGIFNPGDPDRSFEFDGSTFLKTGNTGDHVYAYTSWSVAFWYDLGTSTGTQCFIEYNSEDTTGGTSAKRPPIQIFGIPDGAGNLSMKFRHNLTTEDIASNLPMRGWFGLVLDRDNPATPGVAKASVFSSLTNGNLLNQFDLSGLPQSTVGSSTSCTWWVGNTRSGAPSVSGHCNVTGFMQEVAFYPAAISAPGMRRLYGDCVRNFDEETALASQQGRFSYRLLVEVDDGNYPGAGTQAFLDLSSYYGIDVVQSINITEDMDSPSNRADVQVMRKLSREMNLLGHSQGNAQSLEPEYGPLTLRKQMRIERAFHLGEKPEGWEWQTRFEGFIDSITVNDNVSMTVTCLDRAASLLDTSVLDPRPFSFYNDNETLEEVQQTVVDSFDPALLRTPIGTLATYKGGKPTVHTPAGSSATPTIAGVDQAFRFFEVKSGSVAQAILDVADEVGADVRYRYYEPTGKYRLETYLPRRDYYANVERVECLVTNQATVRTYEPHGLMRSKPELSTATSSVSITNTTNYNIVGAVLSVPDPYTVVVDAPGLATSTAVEADVGRLNYPYNYGLLGAQVRGVTPVRLNVADVRNYVKVRFQRSQSTATLFVTAEAALADSYRVRVTFTEPLDLDPDGNGITFSLRKGAAVDADSAALAGDFSGTVVSATEILSNEPHPSGTFLSSPSMIFESPFLKYKEVVSAYTPSIAAFGFRPAAVHEGSTQGIKAVNEAQALADRIVSDLAYPPIDMVLSARPLPIDLGDVVAMPVYDKDHFASRGVSKTFGIVSVRESCSGGNCSAEYGLRRDKPVRGRAWSRRILDGPHKPTVPTAPAGLLDQAGPWEDVVDRIRATGFGVRFNIPNGIGRHEMSRRTDQMEVHFGATASFIPTDATLVSRGRTIAGRYEMFADGTGFTPGMTYFAKIREIDKDGLYGPVNGLNSSSAATVPSVRVRFLDEGLSSMRVTGGTTAIEIKVSGSTGWFYPDTHTGDAKGLAHLRWSGYTSTTTLQFHYCPTSGVYRAGIRGSLTDSKPGSGIIARLRNWSTISAATPLLDLRFTTETARFTSSDAYKFNFTDTISCASGTWVSWEVQGVGTGGTGPNLLRPSTACADFASVEFQLIAEV